MEDSDRQTRRTSYDPAEHETGEWRRDQISDEEWRDYEWTRTQGFGQHTTYLRGVRIRE